MPKILAIDDKQDNLISIRALLMNLIPDSTIITAQTGPEGIIKARKELPDTILLDIQMPYMDGYEVCKMLKSGELTKHIPIIMITAIRTDLESRVKGLEFGADAFLSKPIDESELVAQIKVMLRIKRAEDLLRNQVELLETTINERTKALKQSEESLHGLSAHLMSVREEERKGIAREIHDELGQSLTALKMDLAWLDKRIIEDNDNLHLKIESISELTDNIIESVRRISSELRPGVLDDLGLCAAIEWQVSEIESRTDIKCNLVFEPEEIEISNENAITIFRILQEALTNVVRHAEASRVDISMTKNDNMIEIKVKDNGKGISDQSLNNKNSFGIIGMRERIKYCGGVFNISSIKSIGTTLEASIPIKQ